MNPRITAGNHARLALGFFRADGMSNIAGMFRTVFYFLIPWSDFAIFSGGDKSRCRSRGEMTHHIDRQIDGRIDGCHENLTY